MFDLFIVCYWLRKFDFFKNMINIVLFVIGWFLIVRDGLGI